MCIHKVNIKRYIYIYKEIMKRYVYIYMYIKYQTVYRIDILGMFPLVSLHLTPLEMSELDFVFDSDQS